MTGTGFTPERIDRAIAAFRAFLRGERRGPLLSLYHAPTYRQEPAPEVMVARACEVIRMDGASGEPNILPTFIPDFGTVSTAAVYGGARIAAHDGGFTHIEPVASRLDQLLELTPRPFEETDYQRAVDLYRQVCERLETADVFVRTPDFQGPMNTLALLIDQTELICGLYEAPDLIRTVLARVTDRLIEDTQRFCDLVGRDRVVGGIWPYTVQPEGMGISLTQDFMPLLSPGLYEEFELPCLGRLAGHFGGAWIHCCGKYAQHLPALAKADMKIWGIEVHYPETPIDDVFAAFGDRIAYVPYVAPTGAERFPTLADFVRSLAGRDCTRGRFWFPFCHEWADAADLRAAIDEAFPQHDDA